MSSERNDNLSISDLISGDGNKHWHSSELMSSDENLNRNQSVAKQPLSEDFLNLLPKTFKI